MVEIRLFLSGPCGIARKSLKRLSPPGVFGCSKKFSKQCQFVGSFVEFPKIRSALSLNPIESPYINRGQTD